MNSLEHLSKTLDARLEALAQYDILDTPAEASFDKMVNVAKFACDASFAAISFIDRDRQWFKAQLGLKMQEMPVGDSFCGHAIANPGKVMVVEDASEDERFAANPLVQGDLQVRFYAGMPITTPEGVAIGAICIYDCQPRLLHPSQADVLRCLAKWVSTFLERRLPELASQRCPTCGGPKHYTGSSQS